MLGVLPEMGEAAPEEAAPCVGVGPRGPVIGVVLAPLLGCAVLGAFVLAIDGVAMDTDANGGFCELRGDETAELPRDPPPEPLLGAGERTREPAIRRNSGFA